MTKREREEEVLAEAIYSAPVGRGMYQRDADELAAHLLATDKVHVDLPLTNVERLEKIERAWLLSDQLMSRSDFYGAKGVTAPHRREVSDG